MSKDRNQPNEIPTKRNPNEYDPEKAPERTPDRNDPRDPGKDSNKSIY